MSFFEATLIFFFTVLAIPSFSQHPKKADYPDKPLRIEIPARSVNETYRIIPCGSKGMILFFRSQEVADESNVKWYFSLYDTNLQLLWVKSIPLLNDMDFRFNQSGKDSLAMLFLHTGKSHAQENDFEIVRVVLKNGTMIINTGKVQQDADVVAFGIQHGLGWLGYNVKGKAGKILTIRLSQGIVRSFFLGQGNQISIKWMQPDSSSATVSTVVSRQVSKKIIEQYMVCYDTAGSIRREIPIGTRDGNRDLTYIQITASNTGASLLLGSYGQDLVNSNQKNKISDESTGFFTSHIINGAQKSINFYNFLEFTNANSLVGERDIINLKKKALKKNKPLAEYSLDFSLLLHPVILWNDQLVLAAEVFSPQYHTESFTDFDYYGRPYTNSFSVFDGYRFFNTIIAGFDMDGKLLWDNTFEIRNLVSLDLSTKVVIFPTGNDLVMCYVSDGKIGTKIIHENTVIEKPDFAPIDLLYPDDKMLSESKGRIVPWYGNYFITYGYQEIKNVAIETNNKRLVYYFSKIRFEN